MRTLIYDALQIAGVGLVASGAGLQWGLPAGLMSAGALLLALSIFDALMAAPRGGQQG
jgi:hypothetical protein